MLTAQRQQTQRDDQTKLYLRLLNVVYNSAQLRKCLYLNKCFYNPQNTGYKMHVVYLNETRISKFKYIYLK